MVDGMRDEEEHGESNENIQLVGAQCTSAFTNLVGFRLLAPAGTRLWQSRWRLGKKH